MVDMLIFASLSRFWTYKITKFREKTYVLQK